MPRRRPKDPTEAPIGEANVLPILNIMFLLIPALLLAMEVASMAAIAINPPNFCDCGPVDPDNQPTHEPLRLAVHIQADGFRVSGTGLKDGGPTVPLARPDAAPDDYDRYNYVALEELARDLESKYSDETTVKVSAEGDIPAQVLIHTLDALRGFDCKLSEDAAPGECLFFHPVVESRASF